METAKRLVFDTSVYIAPVPGGLFSPAFRMLQENVPRTHLASVVSAELLAGATSPVARPAVLDFIRRAHKVRRVITPDAGTRENAGELSARFGRENHTSNQDPQPSGMVCSWRCLRAESARRW